VRSQEKEANVKVELRGIETIRPYEQNPRLNDQAVGAVAKSLREFGFRQPIVVDADGVIICGHTRWKAAQKLGLKQVPVHVATDLTPAQVKAYRIADNQDGLAGRVELRPPAAGTQGPPGHEL
jgi:ParB-like chromosome segregation protein Spo0J